MISLHACTEFSHWLAAARRAASGKRSRPEVAEFCMDLETQCVRLQRELRADLDSEIAWWPSTARIVRIRDPKPRQITIVPFRDRVVHHVLVAAIEPELERYAIHHSYACRRGRGTFKALARAQRLTRRHRWAWKGDIAEFFASIPHARLLARLGRRSLDPQVLLRIERVLGGPRPGCRLRDARGLPIGSLTSQHLANFYLSALDHFVCDQAGVGAYLRYMDDFVAFGERERLRALEHEVVDFLSDSLGLRLNLRRSGIVRVCDGVPFLGVRVFPSVLRPSAPRWRRFCRRYRDLSSEIASGLRDEQDGARALSSSFAYMRSLSTDRARRALLSAASHPRGSGRTWLQPGDPGRHLERQPAERAGGQPQQERAIGAQPERGDSSRELNAEASRPKRGLRAGIAAGSATARSRMRRLYPGVDPTLIPSAASEPHDATSGRAPKHPVPAAAPFAWPPEPSPGENS